jgi:hypothetical protein
MFTSTNLGIRMLRSASLKRRLGDRVAQPATAGTVTDD